MVRSQSQYLMFNWLFERWAVLPSPHKSHNEFNSKEEKVKLKNYAKLSNWKLKVSGAWIWLFISLKLVFYENREMYSKLTPKITSQNDLERFDGVRVYTEVF